jgi:adenylate kinase
MVSHTQQQIETIKQWLGTGSINLFGRPFAGKDTQGRAMADLFNAPLIGGGDILRSGNTPERTIKAINAGFLAPTDDYIAIVLPYLQRNEFKDRPLILSSVGRWHGEEQAVVRAAEAANHPIKCVIYLNVSEETVRERWQKGHEQKSLGDRGSRADDEIEKLATRLQEFANKTLPVIDYYRQAGLLYEIKADEHTAVEITAHILNHFLELASA